MTPRYWYASREARDAIERTLRATAPNRKRWNPLDDSPSLATIRGRAGQYKSRYQRQRDIVFAQAGVEVWYRQHYFRAARCVRRVGFVRVPRP